MCGCDLPPRHRERMRHHGCGCGCWFRQFLTPEEEIEMLEDYKRQLQREIAGVERRARELKEPKE